jgi:hypothetical protein
VKSSLLKNFAIAFYRYRMWLEERQVPDKATLLRDTNHFLAYLTFSSTDFRKALEDQKVFQRALSGYKRFLRSSMNVSDSEADKKLLSIKNFCDFNVWSAAASWPGPEPAKSAPARDRACVPARPASPEPRLHPGR